MFLDTETASTEVESTEPPWENKKENNIKGDIFDNCIVFMMNSVPFVLHQ